jgi:hypothetical protein
MLFSFKSGQSWQRNKKIVKNRYKYKELVNAMQHMAHSPKYFK